MDVNVKEKLTGYDYFTLPVKVLFQHPDYNRHAFRTVMAIGEMTNEQIERLDISNLGVREG